ncbi:MAG: Bacterial regulatory helix-turn-helix protein lysR family, partial [Actinomycetota bacterium]|nr:Bacterial regulatory helix-turn-helix protein lysR family [Actinomycetota bacterium]
PSIRQAAMTMGLKEPAIYTQLVRLERACAGALLIRYTRTHQALTLTPMGKLLLDQADDHFGRAPSSPLEGLPDPLASAVVSLQGPARVRRFVTIAEADSLKHAARILGTHDSTISTQVRMLEAACGGLLLHRRTETATQRLTDLGHLLVEQAMANPKALAAGTVTP